MKKSSWLLMAALAVSGCGDDEVNAEETPNDAGTDSSVGESQAVEVTSHEAAAMAFKLYYRERVQRMLVSYNRFSTFGDSVFTSAIDRSDIAKNGNEYEVVAGPKDNNLIGTAIFSTYQAYRVFRTRTLELTLIRMFNGLAFYEEVSGIPGMTAREVLPGWTRVMDGIDGSVTRTRDSMPVDHPEPPDTALEAEILATFYDGVRFTYRENPAEYLFSYMPAVRVSSYAITHSFSELPDYLRISNCCSSFKRTPDDKKWAGAFWGNHNSRDNFPDIGLGFIAAMEAAADPEAPDDVRTAARRAVEAGKRIGDLIQANGGRMMTVDEHNPYDMLTVGGAVRPHGLSENEDLGSMAACPDVYLARAISSEGLALPAPDLPMPGTVEIVLAAAGVDCEVLTDRKCMGIKDGYCGLEWVEFDQLSLVGGAPLLETIRIAEQTSPGQAESLLGGFQNDFDDIVEAMVAMVHYARVVDDEELLAETREALKDMSNIMRDNADVIWSVSDPDRLARQRYEAAIFDAIGGVEVIEADLLDFSIEEQRIALIEGQLDMADTEPDALLTDEEILQQVEDGLVGLGDHPSGRSDIIRQRYRDAYGMEPPIRRKGDGYEARRAGGDWVDVEVPHHQRVGNQELMLAISICNSSPDVLDCGWARLGCARPDLNTDGKVDDADRDLLDAAETTGCGDDNQWCRAADLDRSGLVDATDEAFMEAAQGCHYEP